MNREDIREKTMQLIFQMDAAGEFDYARLNPVEEMIPALGKNQAIAVLDAVRDHISEIDEMISANLENWTLDRVSKADLAILRNATAEIMYVESLPAAVSINEAVRLSRKYGDDKSYAFVNSVLSKINRSIDSKKQGE
jgi:N utilization substance protein B